jgi:hypothetical protein
VVAILPINLEESCMADDVPSPGTRLSGPGSGSSPASARAVTSALIQSLEGLRERVLDRLDSLETLVRQRPASAPATAEGVSMDPTLARKLATLEETEHRLKAQAERREKEWTTALAQLEADRRLLAEAWERIEQERIASCGGSGVQPNVHSQIASPGAAHGLQRGSQATLPHAASGVGARSAPALSDPNHPVGQAILRQFQTLCSDVRRTAEDRRESREPGRRPES